MRVLQTLIWVSGSIVLAGLLGCSNPPAPQTVNVENPQSVAQPQPVVQPQYVVVQEAPPPLIVEVRPPMPGQGYVWIDGYQHWNGRQYEWHRGEWARPPHEHAVWVAPRYEKHDQGGYRYTPGQWRDEQPHR